MFRHPKYYKELRKLRNKLDQVISGASATASVQRAPGPGPSLTRDSNADGGEGLRRAIAPFLFFLGRVGPKPTSTGCMQKLQYSRGANRELWWGVGGPEGHKHNSQLCDNMLP